VPVANVPVPAADVSVSATIVAKKLIDEKINVKNN
jgi:hypothetical protein